MSEQPSAEKDAAPVCLLHPLVQRIENCEHCTLSRVIPPGGSDA